MRIGNFKNLLSQISFPFLKGNVPTVLTNRQRELQLIAFSTLPTRRYVTCLNDLSKTMLWEHRVTTQYTKPKAHLKRLVFREKGITSLTLKCKWRHKIPQLRPSHSVLHSIEGLSRYNQPKHILLIHYIYETTLKPTIKIFCFAHKSTIYLVKAHWSSSFLSHFQHGLTLTNLDKGKCKM